MHKISNFIGAMGAGAGLMYFLDPQQGPRRRALVSDQATRLVNSAGCALDKLSRDASNRARGLAATATARVANHATPDDRVLSERVRSRMGRAISHPRAIQVMAHSGKVTLSGPILAAEVDDLIACVRGVPGVTAVENHLEVHQEADRHPALQGGMRRGDLRPRNWSPTLRFATGSLGIGLMANCLARRDMPSVLLGTLGFGLFLRSTANEPVRSVIGHTTNRLAGTNTRQQSGRRGGTESSLPQSRQQQAMQSAAL